MTLDTSSAASTIRGAIETLNAGKATTALQMFDELITGHPDIPELLYGKAISLSKLGRHQEAKGVAEMLLQLIPSHSKGQTLIIELSNGSTSSVPTSEASNVQTNFETSRKLFAEGKYPEALQEIIRAKAQRTPVEGLDHLRGQTFLKLQRVDEALEAFKEELRFFPNNIACQEDLKLWQPKVTQVNSTIGDAEFQNVLEKIRPYTMLSVERLWSLFSLAKNICTKNLPGNFIECGVAAGGSSALLAYVIRRYSQRTRWLYSFDSFSGMPPATAADKHGDVNAEATGWGAGTCSAPETSLLSICATLGVADVVRPVKGYFEETLPVWRDRVGMIALLHLDGDWYSSTQAILQNLYDRIVDGGFLQVDDYGYWEGCRKAIHEFESERGIQFSPSVIDGTGVWFEKPDKFPINSLIQKNAVDEFRMDDPVQHGIVSQMSENERFQLYYGIRCHLPQAASVKFVEVGSFSGASFLLSYIALKRVFGEVKGWSVEPGGEPQYYEVMKLLKNDATHLKMYSHPAATILQEVSEIDGIPPSFIFIDGDHTYPGVKQDILDYYPLLAPGGLIAFHDFLPALSEENKESIYFHHANQEPGIRQACIELMEETYKAELIELPLLMPTNPTQTQPHLPIIPGVFSTFRLYRKPL